jgi:hypothetical protein
MSPATMYALLMKRRAFYTAAVVARDHRLGDAAMLEAAFKAFCRFDDLEASFPGMGYEDAAITVLIEFGLTLHVVPRSEHLHMLQRLGAVPADIPPHAFVAGDGSVN